MSVAPNRLLSLSIGLFLQRLWCPCRLFCQSSILYTTKYVGWHLNQAIWARLKFRISFEANSMLVRKNLIFSLIFVQTDNKGRMTTYLLLECMSKLSFLYNYALFFCHAPLVHKHLGKKKNEKLDLHWCD